MLLIISSKENRNSLEEWKPRILQFLVSLYCKYPNFKTWISRVFDEIPFGNRALVLDVDGNNIRGLAVLKDALDEKKICTLRVDENYRHHGIGTALLYESYKILGTDTPLMTVNEEHIATYRPFLTRRGAKLNGYVMSLYYWGKREFFFNHPYRYQVALLSIKPKYVEKMVKGSKRVEFRKKSFSDSVTKVYVYASAPVKKIVGFFDVRECVEGTPNFLWQKFSNYSGLTRKEYDVYFGCQAKGVAIFFDNFTSFSAALDPANIIDDFHAPQSFCYLNNVHLLSQLESISMNNI